MNLLNLSWSRFNCVIDIIKNKINTTQLTTSDAFNMLAKTIIFNLFLLNNSRVLYKFEHFTLMSYDIEINMNNEEKREICGVPIVDMV